MIKNLDIDPTFPDPLKAPKHGLLAFAGDLSAERLIEAYSSGIFPWFDEDDPILWHSPDPRFVLFPNKIKVSKTMRQIINRNIFEVRYDTAFEDVISACADSRIEGTWITD
ncbi:MAG TPA: leucyl/phenylalanyl-tRNA--protein transferase, partial [Spirochaetota bacterium]|nr:leucyl/phenylalanyl-tRNA--protein transferase [Spirochaetota bacterium]